MKEKPKTLKDALELKGAKGRIFRMDSENGQKVYSVENFEGDTLTIKYFNHRTSKIKVSSHLDDIEVVTKLEEGKFYKLFGESEGYVAFYDGNRLTDSRGITLDADQIKNLALIENPESYIDKLYQTSNKYKQGADFIKGRLEAKLLAYELPLELEPEPGDTMHGYDTSEITLDSLEPEDTAEIMPDTPILEEIEEDILLAPEEGRVNYSDEIESDVNLDSFGSGSGLLDLSWHNDDTSLGGLLDEIYTNEERTSEDTSISLAPEEGRNRKRC